MVYQWRYSTSASNCISKSVHASWNICPFALDVLISVLPVVVVIYPQVHPFKLTTALLNAAARLTNSYVRTAVVTGIATESGRVVGVTLDNGEVIPADAVVIAMGPWTEQAAHWLPGIKLPVTGDPVHSIVIRPEAEITGHALFTRYQTGSKNMDPEVCGSVYQALCLSIIRIITNAVTYHLADKSDSGKNGDADAP
jgi:hypothetical protein